MEHQKLLEEIKNKIDLVDFVSEYINLTKTGQNYKALCPFHSEKTPSFFISPTKQIFHCFGCGKGGDIVSFVMEYEKVSFNEALSILAAKAGIKIKQFNDKSNISKEKLYRLYEVASAFYIENLKESKNAYKYLSDRGISSESIQIFKIGFAKEDKAALFQHLIKEGFDERTILLSGLVYNSMDFFRNRIMIPIHDLSGRVIAFGGRLIESDSQLPKYINSTDTTIFRKGENVFGLWHAKQNIKQKGYAIIMEGYIDVILSHQYGFKNAVAPLGTSLTLEQLKRLRRFTDKILLLFDGDEAGILAAHRSLSLLFQSGFIVKVVLLPKGYDPASLLQKHGEKTFKNYIAKAISPVEFSVEINSKKSMSESVHDFLSKISLTKNLIYREELIKELSEKTKISEMTLREELKQIVNSKKKDKSASNIEFACLTSEEENILRIALSFPELLSRILSKVDIEHFENSKVREILIKLIKYIKSKDYNENYLLSIDNFLSYLTEEEKKYVSWLIISYNIDSESISQNLNDCLKRLRLKFIDKKIKLLGKSSDEKLLQSLISQRKEILSDQYEKS